MRSSLQPPAPVTLAGLLEAGHVVAAPKVDDAALQMAIDVLLAYEPEPDDPEAAGLAAVVVFLTREQAARSLRRTEAALRRALVADGVSLDSPKAKAVLRAHARRLSGQDAG